MKVYSVNQHTPHPNPRFARSSQSPSRVSRGGFSASTSAGALPAAQRAAEGPGTGSNYEQKRTPLSKPATRLPNLSTPSAVKPANPTLHTLNPKMRLCCGCVGLDSLWTHGALRQSKPSLLVAFFKFLLCGFALPYSASLRPYCQNSKQRRLRSHCTL